MIIDINNLTLSLIVYFKESRFIPDLFSLGNFSIFPLKSDANFFLFRPSTFFAIKHMYTLNVKSLLRFYSLALLTHKLRRIKNTYQTYY
jgi:hypothetical protein